MDEELKGSTVRTKASTSSCSTLICSRLSTIRSATRSVTRCSRPGATPAPDGARHRHGGTARRRQVRHSAAGQQEPAPGSIALAEPADQDHRRPYQIEGHQIVIGTASPLRWRRPTVPMRRNSSRTRISRSIVQRPRGATNAVSSKTRWTLRRGCAARSKWICATDRTARNRDPLSKHHQRRLPGHRRGRSLARWRHPERGLISPDSSFRSAKKSV